MHSKRVPTPSQVPVTKVFEWLTSGWRFFMRAPGVWVVQTMIFIGVNFATVVLGPLAPFAIALMFPVFCAGMIYGCDLLNRGGTLEITHIFEGFRRHTGNLVVLGGGYLMGFGVIAMIGMLVGGSSVLIGWLIGNLGGIGAFLGGLVLAGFVFYMLWTLLIMALWFAPALVILGKVAPVDALLLSLRACARNLPTFALLGVVLYVITSLAMLAVVLGMLVAMPVIAGAVYASYRDVFGNKPNGEFSRLLKHADNGQDASDAR